jgi:hypothetical protein
MFNGQPVSRSEPRGCVKRSGRGDLESVGTSGSLGVAGTMLSGDRVVIEGEVCGGFQLSPPLHGRETVNAVCKYFKTQDQTYYLHAIFSLTMKATAIILVGRR